MGMEEREDHEGKGVQKGAQVTAGPPAQGTLTTSNVGLWNVGAVWKYREFWALPAQGIPVPRSFKKPPGSD